jgi:hypothetical protein
MYYNSPLLLFVNIIRVGQNDYIFCNETDYNGLLTIFIVIKTMFIACQNLWKVSQYTTKAEFASFRYVSVVVHLPM